MGGVNNLDGDTSGLSIVRNVYRYSNEHIELRVRVCTPHTAYCKPTRFSEQEICAIFVLIEKISSAKPI